ncbi:glycosyl hydrolase family 28-related protein [Ferrovibrio sp.]|uniref:glycosyl hydrolase family 28-related protein n=1 Tax=Ferrovibrio sp. TaxID=1917215 RepID=UPI002ED44234
MQRRDLLSLGSGLALGGMLSSAHAATGRGEDRPVGRQLSARDFGVVGDGRADDTHALQRAFDAALLDEPPGMLTIPPGEYRVSRPLRIAPRANVTRLSGIVAHGARLISAIDNGASVVELVSNATTRFILVEGLEIRGSGRDGHGISIACEAEGRYFYNFCLRDIVVQGCGGDGCRLIGNVFEGQLVNCYFRDNKGNGITFAHGRGGGILSAIHVFGSVFGNNGEHGAAMVNRCYDVSFHGCYFLLNRQFGLLADNGCTLLSNCGFENNHQGARDFSQGDAGAMIKNFGTMIGCTAYSVYQQTHLVRSFIISHLVMVGCTGFGGGKAKQAGLARLNGSREKAQITLLGCTGRVDTENGFEPIEIGGNGSGIRLGSDYRSRNLPRLGEYRLWVDGRGRLRIKKGDPQSDEDGALVGA